jgi:signal transduction histidine kinase
MKKPRKDRRLRRRIIAVFLLAVMLPSLIQAYLGLRYVKQEEQRQEQLVMNGLKGTLAAAARRTEECVHLSVLRALDSLRILTSLPEAAHAHKLQQIAKGNPLLDEVIILDCFGKLRYPRTFCVQKMPGLFQPVLPAARLSLVRGEEYEARGRHQDAIDEYSKGLAGCVSTSERHAFLIRIARCRQKTGDIAGAEKAYKLILEEAQIQFNGEGIPYPIISSLQLASILDKDGRYIEAFSILTGLYQNMLDQFQQFSEKQFLFYFEKINSKLETHLERAGPGAASVLSGLESLAEDYLQEPARNKFLQATVVPTLELATHNRPEPSSIRYAAINIDSGSQILIAYADPGCLANGIRLVGARLSITRLIGLAEDSVKALGTGDNFSFGLLKGHSSDGSLDKNGIAYLAEEPLHLLSGTLQGYKLGLALARGMSLKKFTSSSIRIYYALIFGILAILALGVVFIFHDISREHELTRMKSEFISNVSHEIKTPITTIRSLAENVTEGYITTPEKQKEYFRLIARESEKLSQLIQNTLDFSMIESGNKRYTMEPGSIRELIERTGERFRALTAGQGVEVLYGLDENIPEVRMDRNAMGQALLNLLDNAAKYSTDIMAIRIDARMEGKEMVIAVSDQGIGIDAEDVPRVFDKFYRAESGENKNITGSGIGLTLVKEIVESHGGTISVASEPGIGSTFTIRIPI